MLKIKQWKPQSLENGKVFKGLSGQIPTGNKSFCETGV